MTESTPTFAVLVALLGAAAASDVALHRIPNAMSVAVAATALAARSISGGLLGALSGVAAGLVVGALLYPAWSRRAVGGGDLKLGAAAAIWVGLPGLPRYALASAVAVGLIATWCYAASTRAARREIRANLVAVRLGVAAPVPIGAAGGRVPVPAGAALATGAVVASLLGG
jgi:prepilin peptidase CpaA